MARDTKDSNQMTSEAKWYRKKPVAVEAIQFLPPHNCQQVWEFMGWPWSDKIEEFDDYYHDFESCDEHASVFIETLEGLMEAKPRDFIIKGVQGEFYPCKPSIFAETYEDAS